MGDAVVLTTGGAARGTLGADGVAVFKGIPYGASTAGEGRFAPPQRAPRWEGVRDATAYGPCAPQGTGHRPPGPLTQAIIEPAALFGLPMVHQPQSEDCLVLNVWAPAEGMGDARRPVLFRIHGGGWGSGTGSMAWYDGTNLVRRGDVVVVTVNHRLGALGFLSLSHLGDERFARSANVGLVDLVLALDWVRENIAAFGGDPGNVTIFGESGGGLKTSTLLAMPSAVGLFHRAIIQSGPCLLAREPEAGAELSNLFLAEAGIGPGHLDDLRTVALQRLIDAQGALTMDGTDIMRFGPVLDAATVPHHPRDALAAGASSMVPVMIGSTRHEWSMFWLFEGAPELDEAAVQARLAAMVGAEGASRALAALANVMPEMPLLERYFVAQSTIMMGQASVELAEIREGAAVGVGAALAPTYVYQLAWRSPIQGGRLGAAHGMCAPLSMDNAACAPYSDHPGGHAVAAMMSEAWLAFARAGNPDHTGLPHWPRYSAAERLVMVFDEVPEVVVDPDPELRVALEGTTFHLV